MFVRQRRRRVYAVLAAGALTLSACSAVEPAEGETPTAGGDKVATGPGITKEACPDAVNPSNGCIYLGVLSDLTEGPFAALAVPIVDGQEAFWAKVNKDGGIGGYDIDIKANTRDTKYKAAEHAAMFRQIEPNVLGLAQTLGTVNTEAILEDLVSKKIVSVPTSWWSGYAFDAEDSGIMLETGYSYCTEAVVGLDWFSAKKAKPASVQSVGYPGDYGGDSAAGVARWAKANDADLKPAIGTGPNQVTGNQDAVVSALKKASPDVTVLAVGPAETAEIIGKLAAGGYKGKFLGSLPTWNPALLKSAAGPAMTAMYNHLSPYQNLGDKSAAITAVMDSLGGELPPNDGYLIGWAIGYPLKAALQAAVAKGDVSRAGMAAVVDGLTVDFEGMSPSITYGGNPQQTAMQSVNVSVPDEKGVLGLTTVEPFFKGETFDKTDYSAPCVASK